MKSKIQSITSILITMLMLQLAVFSVFATNASQEITDPDYTDFVRYEVNSEETYRAAITSINAATEPDHLIVITDDFTISDGFADEGGDSEEIFSANNTVIISEGDHTVSLWDFITSEQSVIVRVTGTATVSVGDANTSENTLTLDGCSPTDLTVGNAFIKEYSGRYGIYVYGANATVNMYDGVTVTRMNSETGGDLTAVYVYNSATFNMYGGLITDNIINNSNSGYSAGVVYIRYAYFNMYGGTITNVLDARTSSTYYYGTVISAKGSGVYIEDATIDANVTASTEHEASTYYVYGGAIYFSDSYTSAVSDTSLTIKNSNITGDDTATYGGGVYIYKNKTVTTITIEDTTFADNFASYYGGALYIAGPATQGVIEISGCTFTNNAANYGGAVSLGTSLTGVDSVDFTDCTFTGNESYYGGAILTMAGVPMNIVDCDFDSNNAYTCGGAISYYNATNSLNITNSTFTDNYASAGGAIFAYNESEYETTNINLLGTTSITGNYTENSTMPGAVYLSSTIHSLNIEDTVTVKDNYGIIRDETNAQTGTVAMDIFVEFIENAEYTTDHTINFILTKDLALENAAYEALVGFFYPSSETMALTVPHYDVHIYYADGTEYGEAEDEIVQLVLNTYLFSDHEDYYLIDSSLATDADYDGDETDIYKELQAFPTTIYYANDGSDAYYTDETQYKYYETTTILGDVFTLDGKEIASWNTSADGTGDTYEIGDKVTRSTDSLYLYAIWADMEETTSAPDDDTDETTQTSTVTISDSATSTTSTEIVSPYTGDAENALCWMLLLAPATGIALLLAKKNKI